MKKFKDIKGYEGLYQISKCGIVKSLERKVKNSKKGYRIIKEKEISNHISTSGYKVFRLYRDQKCEHKSCHRLIYENFIGELKEGLVINHINENKLDNRIENLEQITHKENCNYGSTQVSKKGKNNYRYKHYSFYETHPSYRHVFKNVCKRQGYNLEDFEEVYSNIKNIHHQKKFFYIKKNKNKIIEMGVDLGDGKDSTIETKFITKGDDVIILDIKRIK